MTERSGVNRGVLTELLSNSYKDAQICPLHKKYFNDSRGIELIKQLGIPECSNIDKSVLNRFHMKFYRSIHLPNLLGTTAWLRLRRS